MPIDQPTPEHYRQEAVSLRKAAEIIRDQRLADQLLSIAGEYEAAAVSIEAQLGPRGRPSPSRDLPEAAD